MDRVVALISEKKTKKEKFVNMAGVVASWGLAENVSAQIIEVLNENIIDDETLTKLTPHLIEELFPKIGLRLHFTEKWEAQYGELQKPPTNRDSDIESVHSDVVATSSNTEHDKDYALKRQNAFYKRVPLVLRSERINVISIVKKSIRGQAIVKSYKTKKTLVGKSRTVIVDLVMSEVLSKTKRLRNDDLEFLAQKIVEAFPTEDPRTYYIPPIKKAHSREKKSVVARGKLVDKYRNLMRTCREKSDNEAGENASTASRDPCSNDDDELAIEQARSWLEKNSEPWEVVVANWNRTKGLRHKTNIHELTQKVCDIFVQWPILKHPNGCDLIEKDFAQLNLATAELDNHSWTAFYTTLERIRPLRRGGDDSNGAALQRSLEIAELNEDTRFVLQLLLLPHMLPPKVRVSCKNHKWKPSISECKDSIVLHATAPSEIVKLREERQESMQSRGLTLQPFIVVCGIDLFDLKSFYVCIDQVMYKVPSALKALDVCFKCFHAVLNALYPPESEYLWILLQRKVYNFSTKWDKMSPQIIETLSDWRELDKENIMENE